MTTTPQPHPPLARAEVNRRMVAGELTPTAARDMTIDLYKADPTRAARLVAPDQPSGEAWDTTATLHPKTGRGRTPSPGARPAHDAPIVAAPIADVPTTVPTDDAEPAPTSLGAFIASARDDKGLTRTQLGTAIGARSDIIKAYEEGRRLPSSFMAPRLAEALDVDPDLLRALIEAQDRPQTASRRTTRRSTAARSKGTGKARGTTTGTATAARAASTTTRPRTAPRQTAPVTPIDAADTEQEQGQEEGDRLMTSAARPARPEQDTRYRAGEPRAASPPTAAQAPEVTDTGFPAVSLDWSLAVDTWNALRATTHAWDSWESGDATLIATLDSLADAYDALASLTRALRVASTPRALMTAPTTNHAAR